MPLALIVFSSVCISFQWAGDLLYRVTGSEPPPRRGPGEVRRSTPPLDVQGLQTLFARAERQVEGWKSISLRLPPSPEGPWTFAIDRGDGPRPDRRSQLTLDPKTGDVVSFEPYPAQSAGRRLRSWVRWVHTGEAGGFLGQTIAGIASGGATVLVWTGLALALRRFRAWLARRVESRGGRESVPAPNVGDGIEQA